MSGFALGRVKALAEHWCLPSAPAGRAELGAATHALLALRDAVAARRTTRCWSRSPSGRHSDATACVCGLEYIAKCPCTAADAVIDAAHLAIEALP